MEMSEEDRRKELDKRTLWRLKDTVESLVFHLDSLHSDFLGSNVALRKLFAWTPTYTNVEKFKKSSRYEEGNEYAPFFTEAYLYNLLGKSDARTLLSLLKKALGIKGIVRIASAEELSTQEKLSEQEQGDLWDLKERVESLVHSIKRLHPDFLGVSAALDELLKWTPEQTDEEEFKSSPHYEEGNEGAPFFSEAYLYVLLGKSDARTLLTLMREALGVRRIRKL